MVSRENIIIGKLKNEVRRALGTWKLSWILKRSKAVDIIGREKRKGFYLGKMSRPLTFLYQ